MNLAKVRMESFNRSFEERLSLLPKAYSDLDLTVRTPDEPLADVYAKIEVGTDPQLDFAMIIDHLDVLVVCTDGTTFRFGNTSVKHENLEHAFEFVDNWLNQRIKLKPSRDLVESRVILTEDPDGQAFRDSRDTAWGFFILVSFLASATLGLIVHWMFAVILIGMGVWFYMNITEPTMKLRVQPTTSEHLATLRREK